MSTIVGHRIAEAARLSGFPAASLRYYEQIGLMPATSRTVSGYRLYSDRDIDRLRFIARAKQLGCTLEEIGELAGAWDHDECGPVQHHLADLVGQKIADTRARIAELLQFEVELQVAATSLARTPNEGACDDSCHCMVVGSPDGPVVVELTHKAVAARADEPVACSLGAGDVQTRIAEWRTVLDHVTERSAIEGGLRLVLDAAAPLDDLLRLVGAEHDCCPSFSFAVTIDGRGTALQVTAPGDAADMIEAVFGAQA
jgi:MerR family copper efflux transcriptional regulator